MTNAVSYVKGLTLSNGQLVSDRLRKTCVVGDHAIQTEAFYNHRTQLIRTVANCCVNLRLRHQCISYTRFVQGESCRSVLGKTILFKGQ